MTSQSRLIYAALVFLGALCGCAATPESEGLIAPRESQQARLDVSTSYRYGGGTNSNFEVGVQAGTFHLEWESPTGMYYLADAPSVWWKVVPDKVLLFKKAGIWIPHDKSQQPRIYIYNSGGHVMLSALDERGSATADSAQNGPTPPGGADGLTHLAVDSALRSSGTPLQAGVGAGLGVGIAMAIADYDHNVPSFHPAPPSAAFANHLRTSFFISTAK